MSLAETKILTKKTSKHPRESSIQEYQEHILVDNYKQFSPKKDIFAMPNIFLNEALLQNTSTKTPERPMQVQQQKQKIPIASREVVKRMISQRRKKLQKAKVVPTNLSLIQQTESEHNISSSSKSNSVLDQSSIDYVLSQEHSSESQDDDQINQSFIGESQQEEQDDVLNKTVVMSKKKGPKEFEILKTPKKLSQKQKVHLQILAKKYSLDKLQTFYLQGKLKQIQYLHILHIKKQQQKRLKQEKFYQNLQKAEKLAHIIDQNYNLIQKRLFKDIEKDRLKLKNFTHQIIEIDKQKQKKCKLPNPKKSKLQLKTLEILAELNAKQNFLSMLKSARQEFQLEYNNHIQKIQDKKRVEENISQNLIFIEIKQLINKNQQNYQYLAQSLVKGRKSKCSLIACDARKHYLNLLQQKFARQILKIQEFKEDHVTNQIRKLFKQQDKFQITQEKIQKLKSSAQQKVFVKLHETKQQFLNHFSWLKMIRQNGQLKEGRIFKQSAWIMTNNMPLNFSFSQQKQKYLLENFKFYRRKVFKILQSKFQTIKQIHDFFQTSQGIQWQKAQNNKKQKFLKNFDLLQKKVSNLEICYKKKNTNSILFSKGWTLKKDSNKNTYEFLTILNKKIENLSKLKDKAQEFLQFQATKISSKRKSIIPQRKVVKVDLRTQKFQILQRISQVQKLKNSKKNDLKDKLDSKQRIIHKPEILKSQEGRDGQNLENLCMNLDKIKFNNEYIERIKNYDKQEGKKYTEPEKKKHMDKVYELILKGQVFKSQNEENQSYQYCAKTPWEVRKGYLQKIRFSHQKPLQGSQQLQLEQFLMSLNKINKPQFTKPSLSHSLPSLNQNFTVSEIDEACKKFTKEFYMNPQISSRLNLNQQQFYFLMSPQYRKYFMDKKIKDQQLQQRILNLIRNNPYPINQSSYQSPQQNPINHMIQTDPYFQQRIQQYQQKIVKNQQIIDPYQPKLILQNLSQDYSRRESINSLFDPFESRVHEIQAKRSFNYWSQNKSDYDTVASQNEEFQEWLCNRC